jgi:hypothetical protein
MSWRLFYGFPKNLSYKTGRLLSVLGLPRRIQAQDAARMASVRLAGIVVHSVLNQDSTHIRESTLQIVKHEL